MEYDSPQAVAALVAAQRRYFVSGVTRPESFRRTMLCRLRDALDTWEGPLCEALRADLHKSPEESILTELSVVRAEVREHLRHLRRWMRPERRPTPLKLFPSRSRVVCEPLGVALVIAPWNYPVQLLLNPLVGALSAGCTAVLKPSPRAPHVADVVARMVDGCFPAEHVAVVRGGREANEWLLAERFDRIFFTGSATVGRAVMAAAARHLTPVVLELGGKSPCIVDRGADLDVAARRIAWGKALNAGQTCVAPDYLLVHESLRDSFAAAFARAVRALLGDDPQRSPHYARLIDGAAYDRLEEYLSQGEVLTGGRRDRSDRYVEPTLLGGVDDDAPAMREELFGPLLPLRTFRTTEEAVRFVNARERPLALYYFGPEAEGWRVVERTSSGGACINDTVIHLANGALPFGGVGESGMGRYHGRESFEVFSHRRAVVATPARWDLPFRYMPYRWFRWVRGIL